MEIFLYLLLAITTFIILILVFSALTQSTRAVSLRLSDVQYKKDENPDDMQRPFAERVLYPVYKALFNLVDRLTPRRMEENYRKVLLQAGQSERMTPVRLLLLQVLLSVTVTAFVRILAPYAGISVNPLIILVLAVIMFLYPFVRFNSMATLRQTKIRKQLPDFLDMLYISVEAGLSFDAAMKQTAVKMRGPLSQEIIRAMDDITKGRDREGALRSIGKRSQVEEVNSFITAVIQSEMLGSNIANMLKIQARVMREKRRQRAEEDAQKMPLKMLFPMVLFMFPALFIVILGPAVINIIEMLGDVL